MPPGTKREGPEGTPGRKPRVTVQYNVPYKSFCFIEGRGILKPALLGMADLRERI